MKYLFIFLLVSSSVFSQNYHYAVDEAKEAATPDTTTPSNPINLVASAITETTVTLSWTAATDNVGVVDYRVYNNDILLLDSTEGAVTSFTLTGLNPATDYLITVRALDASANESNNSNNQTFVTLAPDTTAPTPPINLVISNITQTTATLSWTASTDDVGISVYRIYNNGSLLNSTNGSVTTFNLIGLTPSTIYDIMLRAVDAVGNESQNSNNQSFTTSQVPEFNPDNNLPEEIAYFSSYLLPLSQKTQLQNALNTYGSVRLEAGDYSGTPITMTSNQSLYGSPSANFSQIRVPNITIAAGSTNVRIDNVADAIITFAAGSPITNSTIKSVFYSELRTTGGQIENCEFINLDHSLINFNCSTSGYIRNNRVIKQWVQGGSPQALMKGNSTTPSYGNVQSFIIYQTSAGNVSDYDRMGDMTFIGIDSEAWGYTSPLTEAMLKMTNMGDVHITDFGGGNGGSSYKTPAMDIQAGNLTIYNKGIQNHSGTNNIARANTNVFQVVGDPDDIYLETGTGFNLKMHLPDGATMANYNGTNQTSTISNITAINNISDIILRPKYSPIDRYNYPTLPDPTGSTWSTDRTGKPDSTSYIQDLINTNGIAKLPEGIFYISSTLILKANNGIIGAGTGKTAIVGLTDDFPLITMTDIGPTRTFILTNLTLQGGRTGVRVTPSGSGLFQLSGNNWKYVVFRNQNYGFHLEKIYGMDTNMMEGVSFVDCNIGFFQDPNPSYAGGEPNDMSYVDKLMMYKCQFINNNIAISMNATRANNLNAWHNCLFKGNKTVANISSNNTPIFTNSDFINNTGEYLIEGGEASIYSCNFSGNSSKSLFKVIILFMEGCKIMDNVPLIADNPYNPENVYITNSIITGDKGAITNAVLVNNTFSSHPALSKLLVNIINGTATTLINTNSEPYPQYLVRH